MVLLVWNRLLIKIINITQISYVTLCHIKPGSDKVTVKHMFLLPSCMLSWTLPLFMGSLICSVNGLLVHTCTYTQEIASHRNKAWLQWFSFFQDHDPDVDQVPGEKVKHLDTQWGKDRWTGQWLIFSVHPKQHRLCKQLVIFAVVLLQ